MQNVIDETPGERTVRVIGKRTIDLGKDFSKFIHELDGVSSVSKLNVSESTTNSRGHKPARTGYFWQVVLWL